MYESRRDQSSAQLKQPPVTLSPNWRAAVGLALLEKLTELGCQVLVVAVAGQHAHLLVKLPNGDARHWIGLAKKNASFAIHAAGWQGRLWGMRSKIVRIRDHEQQLNTFRYILKHQAEGAWTYDFRSQR
jgi:REP element-mobilizing transposase RayT